MELEANLINVDQQIRINFRLKGMSFKKEENNTKFASY